MPRMATTSTSRSQKSADLPESDRSQASYAPPYVARRTRETISDINTLSFCSPGCHLDRNRGRLGSQIHKKLSNDEAECPPTFEKFSLQPTELGRGLPRTLLPTRLRLDCALFWIDIFTLYSFFILFLTASSMPYLLSYTPSGTPITRALCSRTPRWPEIAEVEPGLQTGKENRA
ncbi:hypothetical protein B0H14DRAFT_3138021 [Mycena olivaceomarginata]|nr:hypothetical protein B0H14DRAFT_3138021 [Mycena olivaceomarginata]